MTHTLKWLNWLPWNFVIKKIAYAHGFLDPVNLLAQLQRFTQPTAVREPIELLRAGAVLHARGLINSRVIQHNLDWVWPYWVEQQFNPSSPSFIPRAFSITHINLTHRNWTALGVPDFANLPIVDPRGLLTPFLDLWSLDVWVKRKNGSFLLPSRAVKCQQILHLKNGLLISTHTHLDKCDLNIQQQVEYCEGNPVCIVDIHVTTPDEDTLVIALRPYNPEGISFIHQLDLNHDHTQWTVDKKFNINFDRAMHQQLVSDYRTGDVYSLLKHHSATANFTLHHNCTIGMLTAAALFTLKPNTKNSLRLSIPLSEQTAAANSRTKTTRHKIKIPISSEALWQKHLQGISTLQIPDTHMQFLYDAAIRTLMLHTVDKVYPGPYTYKRFWYRDATFIIYALLCVGLTARAEHALDYFPEQQQHSGYFHSQEGEWDSNGQALWIFNLFYEFTRKKTPPHWQTAIDKGVQWLINKRLPDQPAVAHAGLLPAGFSAEHLGPIDFYYWDDYWALAGLQAASQLANAAGQPRQAALINTAASEYFQAIEKSTAMAAKRLNAEVLPASPYRRLDAGAIGSIVSGYPLKLYTPNQPKLINTVNFLIDNCFFDGGFFQDMIHSGINPYLTLHIAQVLLRAGDLRFFDLMTCVANSASATGQWPEAIHPHTRGGCMGDGQHAWAAAEWIVMMRNCFVREESEKLILVSGIVKNWWASGKTLAFTQAPTAFGEISVTLRYYAEGLITKNTATKTEAIKPQILVRWQSEWHAQPPVVEVHLPGFEPIIATENQTDAVIFLSTAL